MACCARADAKAAEYKGGSQWLIIRIEWLNVDIIPATECSIFVFSKHGKSQRPKMKAAQRIEQALQQIVCQPEHDEALIAEYFSPHYQQWVDGKSLDFDGFVQHMAAVKAATSSVCIEIQAIAENGNEVLTHHRVSVVKPDASEAVIDVFARFTLCEGMIVRCQELTYPLSGAEEDRDLGSRR